MKTKVAIDAKFFAKKNIGSLGYSLIELINNLQDYDLLFLSDKEIPTQYIPNNAKVIVRGEGYTGGSDLYRYQKWMKKVMEDENVDCYYQINHFSVVPTKGIKQIVIVHDLYTLDNIEKHTVKQKIVYRVSLFLTMLNADRIFTVSEFTKRRLEHHLWKSKKIEVNYDGVNEPPEIPNLDQYACVEGPFCLMLGRVNYFKGTMRIVELFDKYLSDSGYKLVLAGEAKTDDVANQMRAITDRNRNIIWLNYVDDNTKEWLFRNCALFIYAANYDGFGVPPLEAAIRKKKALISDIEILREVTKGKGNYVNFKDDDQIVVGKIREALSTKNSDQIDELYEVARSYTWKKFADKIIREIENR